MYCIYCQQNKIDNRSEYLYCIKQEQVLYVAFLAYKSYVNTAGFIRSCMLPQVYLAYICILIEHLELKSALITQS